MKEPVRLERPIVVVGAPRTGTSIVFDALARHPDLAFLSQYSGRHPGLPGLNALRPLLDNPLWRVTGAKRQVNAQRWYNRYAFRPSECYPLWGRLLGERFARGFLLDERATPAERAAVRAHLARVVALQRRERAALKFTGPGRVGFLLSLFPDARFVRVVREPLPTLRSLVRAGFWKARRDAVQWHGAWDETETRALLALPRDGAVLAGRQLRRVLDTTDAELAALRPPLFELGYEDFVADPAGRMRAVLDFAGLAPDARVLDFDGAFRIHDRNAGAEGFFSAAERAALRELFPAPAAAEGGAPAGPGGPSGPLRRRAAASAGAGAARSPSSDGPSGGS